MGLIGSRDSRPAGIRAVAERHPIPSFLFVAYAIALVTGIPEVAASRGALGDDNPVVGLLGVAGAVGPALAAVVVAGLARGRGGIDDLLDGLFRGAGRLRWYVLVLLLQAALSGVALLLTVTLGDAASVAIDWAALPVVLLGLLFMLTLWEELGFRGFAQREAQKRYSPLSASLFVGIAWAVWHLPVLFVAGNPTAEVPPALLFLDVLGVSVIYAWIYNRAAQSVLFVALFHAAGNAFGLVASEGGVELGTFLAFRVPLVWVTVVVVVLVFGKNLQAPAAVTQHTG